jgi:transposase
VKPFVKRQKNDAADAEAICEAAQRPTMRFVPVKSEEPQGAAMVFRVRDLLIRQRTQAINALRGHLSEFGQIVPQGAANTKRLIAIVEDPDSRLPTDAIATLKVLVRVAIDIPKCSARLSCDTASQFRPSNSNGCFSTRLSITIQNSSCLIFLLLMIAVRTFYFKAR